MFFQGLMVGGSSISKWIGAGLLGDKLLGQFFFLLCLFFWNIYEIYQLLQPSDPAPPVGGDVLVPNVSQQSELICVVPPIENTNPDQSSQHFTSTPPMPPAFYPPAAPLHLYPVWYGSTHKILKPVPVHVDEVASMSKLQISDAVEPREQPGLSLKLFESSSSRQSFHSKPSISIPDLNKNTSSAIRAV
jgi:hypothetical protein